MLSGPSFKSAFVFSINSLILPGFPFTSFHLAEASLPAFSQFYTLVCAVIQKYHVMSFIYNYSDFQYSFCNRPVLFAHLEYVNASYVRTNEIKTKAKPIHVTFKLIMRSIIQFSQQIMMSGPCANQIFCNKD